MARWAKMKDVRESLGVSAGHLSYKISSSGTPVIKLFGETSKYMDLDIFGEDISVDIHFEHNLDDCVCLEELPWSESEIRELIGQSYSFKMDGRKYIWGYLLEGLEHLLDDEEESEVDARRRSAYRKNCPKGCCLRNELISRYFLTLDEISVLESDLEVGSGLVHTEFGTYYNKAHVVEWVLGHIPREELMTR